ncbi:hypothetical protein [Parafrankia soli]|nr:hypothetical protein [Parafrankia soli]
MTFHPLSGLFQPGEGPSLREDVVDACAFAEHGRWRTTRCGSSDTPYLVEGAAPEGDEPLLCGPHADRWSETPAVLGGMHTIHFLPED